MSSLSSDGPVRSPAGFPVTQGLPPRRAQFCGLQMLDPQPDDPTLAWIYQKEYYDAWGIQRDEELARTMKRATFARFLRPTADSASRDSEATRLRGRDGLLDGGGRSLWAWIPYGAELSEFGATRIAEKFGTDRASGPLRAGQLRRRRRRLLRYHHHDRLHRARPFPDVDSGQGVSSLAAGRTMVILTPNADSLSRRLMGLRWLHYKVEHLYYFGPRSLTRALRQVGLTEVRVGRAWKMMNLHYLATSSRSLRTRCYRRSSPWLIASVRRAYARECSLSRSVSCSRRPPSRR